MPGSASPLHIRWVGERWHIEPPRPMDIETLLIGKSVHDACELVPLIYNVCSAAQRASVCSAFDVPVDETLADRIRQERGRDHQRLFFVSLPQVLGMSPRLEAVEWPLPEGNAFREFLLSSDALPAQVWREIKTQSEHWRQVDLPAVNDVTAWNMREPFENSLAVFLKSHPALQWVIDEIGYSPAWRLAARLLDAAAIAHGEELFDRPMAARGQMFSRGTAAEGDVTSFERRSPTDALLMPGGLLHAMLEDAGPDAKIAKLLVEIGSPCVPWEVAHA